MNKDITLAACCLVLISTQALANRPAMSENTEVFEPEEVEISTSTDHRPALAETSKTTAAEDNVATESPSEKEPVIRVYNHRTETQVTGDALELQPNETLPVQAPDFPRRGMSMEEVRKELGEPLETSPAVGSPPITRWTYSDRTVYFEYSKVVHVVADP